MTSVNMTTIDMRTAANPQTDSITFNFDWLPDDDEGIQFAERIYAMIPEYESLVQRKRESDILSYSSEHDALVMERRKLAEQEQELAEEQRLLTTDAAEIDNQIHAAISALKRLREDDAPNPMWATQADLDKYNVKVAQAEGVLREAQFRQTEHNEYVADWRERYSELSGKIDGLGEEVKNVWIKMQRAKGHKVSSIDKERGLPE